MSFNDPVHLSPAGYIPGDFTAHSEPEQDREPMCVDCGVSPPAESADDGLCIDCAVRFFTQHPEEFDDTPERYFALSADLAAVRDRVCMERLRARGRLIEQPLISVSPGPTEAHREAAGIIAAASVEAAKAGKAEVAELLLRAARRMKDAT
jgi:hypothetical protein